jgi:hypothetical protein
MRDAQELASCSQGASYDITEVAFTSAISTGGRDLAVVLEKCDLPVVAAKSYRGQATHDCPIHQDPSGNRWSIQPGGMGGRDACFCVGKQ